MGATAARLVIRALGIPHTRRSAAAVPHADSMTLPAIVVRCAEITAGTGCLPASIHEAFQVFSPGTIGVAIALVGTGAAENLARLLQVAVGVGLGGGRGRATRAVSAAFLQ